MPDPAATKLAALAEQTLNERLLDLSIRHATFLERFKAGEVRRILQLLEENTWPELLGIVTARLERISARGFDTGPWRTARYKEMLKAVRATIGVGVARAAKAQRASLQAFAIEEAAMTAGQLTRTTGVAVDFLTPSPATLRQLVTGEPILGQPLAAWWKGQTRATQAAVEREIATGVSFGESSADIVRRLRGTKAAGFRDGAIQTSRNGAEAIVRTSTNHISSRAREETYKANDDVVEKVLYVATLDSHTTMTCAGLDGQTFPIGEGPRPPMHVKCRSTTAPVVGPIEGMRASASGPVPAKLTYPQWLRKQPIAVQNQVLGAKRATAWRGNRIKFDRFLGADFRPMTLQELVDTDRLTP